MGGEEGLGAGAWPWPWPGARPRGTQKLMIKVQKGAGPEGALCCPPLAVNEFKSREYTECVSK